MAAAPLLGGALAAKGTLDTLGEVLPARTLAVRTTKLLALTGDTSGFAGTLASLARLAGTAALAGTPGEATVALGHATCASATLAGFA